MADSSGALMLMNYLMKELLQEGNHVSNPKLFMHALLVRFEGGMKLNVVELYTFLKECDKPNKALLVHTLQRSFPEDEDWDRRSPQWSAVILAAATRVLNLDTSPGDPPLTSTQLPHPSMMSLVLSLAASRKIVKSLKQAPSIVVVVPVVSLEDIIALRSPQDTPLGIDLIRTVTQETSWLSISCKWVVVDCSLWNTTVRELVLGADPTAIVITHDPVIDNGVDGTMHRALFHMKENAQLDWGTHIVVMDSPSLCKMHFGQIGSLIAEADTIPGSRWVLHPKSSVMVFPSGKLNSVDQPPLAVNTNAIPSTSEEPVPPPPVSPPPPQGSKSGGGQGQPAVEPLPPPPPPPPPPSYVTTQRNSAKISEVSIFVYPV